MSFVLGMTLTAILLIGCAGGGIWYWLKIKEAPKKLSRISLLWRETKRAFLTF